MENTHERHEVSSVSPVSGANISTVYPSILHWDDGVYYAPTPCGRYTMETDSVGMPLLYKSVIKKHISEVIKDQVEHSFYTKYVVHVKKRDTAYMVETKPSPLGRPWDEIETRYYENGARKETKLYDSCEISTSEPFFPTSTRARSTQTNEGSDSDDDMALVNALRKIKLKDEFKHGNHDITVLSTSNQPSTSVNAAQPPSEAQEIAPDPDLVNTACVDWSMQQQPIIGDFNHRTRGRGERYRKPQENGDK